MERHSYDSASPVGGIRICIRCKLFKGLRRKIEILAMHCIAHAAQ